MSATITNDHSTAQAIKEYILPIVTAAVAAVAIVFFTSATIPVGALFGLGILGGGVTIVSLKRQLNQSENRTDEIKRELNLVQTLLANAQSGNQRLQATIESQRESNNAQNQGELETLRSEIRRLETNLTYLEKYKNTAAKYNKILEMCNERNPAGGTGNDPLFDHVQELLREVNIFKRDFGELVEGNLPPPVFQQVIPTELAREIEQAKTRYTALNNAQRGTLPFAKQGAVMTHHERIGMSIDDAIFVESVNKQNPSWLQKLKTSIEQSSTIQPPDSKSPLGYVLTRMSSTTPMQKRQ